MPVERLIPCWPAWSKDAAEHRALRWQRGEYPPVSVPEILGFADAELEAWRTWKVFPERQRRTFRKKAG